MTSKAASASTASDARGKTKSKPKVASSSKSSNEHYQSKFGITPIIGTNRKKLDQPTSSIPLPTSDLFVSPLRKDILYLLGRFAEEWTATTELVKLYAEGELPEDDTLEGRQVCIEKVIHGPLKLFSKLWIKNGWNYIHLIVGEDDSSRIAFYEVINRVFQEHLHPFLPQTSSSSNPYVPAPWQNLRAIGSLFGMYHLYATQPKIEKVWTSVKEETDAFRAKHRINIELDVYKALMNLPTLVSETLEISSQNSEFLTTELLKLQGLDEMNTAQFIQPIADVIQVLRILTDDLKGEEREEFKDWVEGDEDQEEEMGLEDGDGNEVELMEEDVEVESKGKGKGKDKAKAVGKGKGKGKEVVPKKVTSKARPKPKAANSEKEKQNNGIVSSTSTIAEPQEEEAEEEESTTLTGKRKRSGTQTQLSKSQPKLSTESSLPNPTIPNLSSSSPSKKRVPSIRNTPISLPLNSSYLPNKGARLEPFKNKLDSSALDSLDEHLQDSAFILIPEKRFGTRSEIPDTSLQTSTERARERGGFGKIRSEVLNQEYDVLGDYTMEDGELGVGSVNQTRGEGETVLKRERTVVQEKNLSRSDLLRSILRAKVGLALDGKRIEISDGKSTELKNGFKGTSNQPISGSTAQDQSPSSQQNDSNLRDIASTSKNQCQASTTLILPEFKPPYNLFQLAVRKSLRMNEVTSSFKTLEDKLRDVTEKGEEFRGRGFRREEVVGEGSGGVEALVNNSALALGLDQGQILDQSQDQSQNQAQHQKQGKGKGNGQTQGGQEKGQGSSRETPAHLRASTHERLLEEAREKALENVRMAMIEIERRCKVQGEGYGKMIGGGSESSKGKAKDHGKGKEQRVEKEKGGKGKGKGKEKEKEQ